MMTWFDVTNIHWRDPLLLLIALQPLLLITLRRLREQKRLRAYADPALHPWIISHEKHHWLTRIFSRDTAYIIAWLLFAVSASGPRLAQEIPGAPTDNGVDIMTVLDVSKSMHTKDIHPSRLLRTRIELHELMGKLNRERLGIVVYAARPHLLSPLTPDHEAIKYYLNILDSLTLPTRGSNVADALNMARKQFKQNSKRKKAILLVTDGDIASLSEQDKDKLLSQVQDLDKDNISLYILGMSTVEGDAVPDAEGGWLSFNGKPVVSRMDESTLQKLALLGNGLFSQVTDDDSDWVTLYKKGISSQRFDDVDETDETDSHSVIWHELYPWTLLPAVIFLFISIIPYRLQLLTIQKTSGAAIPATALLLLLFLPVDEPLADNEPELEAQAYQYFQSEKHKQAMNAYLELPGYRGRLGEGASAYRLGDYSRAVTQFSQAVLEAQDDKQRAVSLFNLGNSYFKTGNYAAAIISFNDALLYRPEHQPTKRNLEFSKTLQKAVQKEMEEFGSTDRMGQGPRLARASDSIEFNESGAASYGESDDTDKEEKIEQELPDNNDRLFEILVARGVEQAKLAASTDTGVDTAIFDEDPNILSLARIHMRKLEHKQSELWKRMFEIEEGFAAPQAEPHQVPGIAPW